MDRIAVNTAECSGVRYHELAVAGGRSAVRKQPALLAEGHRAQTPPSAHSLGDR